jgi:formylglycine-generating enzyme required for sulfatase activity
VADGSVRLFGVDRSFSESEMDLGWVDFSGVVLRRPTVGETPVDLTRRVNPIDGQTYIYIPPGQFTMGCSPADTECYDDERPTHEVKITRGFWIGRTEATQAAWARVMKSANPSLYKGADRPVETVTWDEARAFCEASGLRLPTEAEWEYAARAGSKAARYGSLDQIAWYTGNSRSGTHPVAQKTPNAWGVYDILGNVFEWVHDWYGNYPPGAVTDPRGPSSGPGRVLRGGSWFYYPEYVRVSNRGRYEPTLRNLYIGFRCAGDLP